MKKAAVIVCVFCVYFTQAQFKDQIHNLTLFQLGSGKHIPEVGNAYKFTKTNHLMLEWDWYHPEIGWWMEYDASFLGNIIKKLGSDEVKNGSNIDAVDVTKGFNGALMTASLGWMFNNNKPFVLGFGKSKIGMGLVLGGHGFDTDSLDRAIVIFGPEIGSFTTIGNKFNLFTKLSLPVMINRGFIGSKPNLDLKLSYQIVNGFGLTLASGLESYRFNDQSRYGSEQNPYQDKFKFNYLQLGISVILD